MSGERVTCEPAIYAMDHRDLTVSNVFGNSIGTQGLMFLSFILSDFVLVLKSLAALLVFFKGGLI